MTIKQSINTPNDRDRILRYIRRFCQPETCNALQFDAFISEIGNRRSAEAIIRELWQNGLVNPTDAEIDPEDGALFKVPMPTIEDPIKDSTQFVLSDLGYKSVDLLYDPFGESSDICVPKKIITITEFIDAKLLEELNKNPKRMFSLSPRQFEELVAELFYREGFDVELTPERKDGGRDVLAVSHNELGSHLYMAECKRYSPNRPVGVEYVRALYGVVEYEKATLGIIATTSCFTKGAKSLSQDLKWRIGLKDYTNLQTWIKKHN